MSQHYYNAQGELVDPWTKGAYSSPSTILGRLRSFEYEALVARMGQEDADILMDNAAARGTRVHKACELWLGNGFDATGAAKESGLLVEEVGYLAGFINWWEKYGPGLIASEVFLASDKYKFAGTADLIVYLDGELWVIDIKTGMDNVRHGLQLKFYQQAYFEMSGKKALMGVLALDGKRMCGYRNSRSPYGLKEFKEPLAAILAHLNVHKWWARKMPIKEPVVSNAPVWAPEDI